MEQNKEKKQNRFLAWCNDHCVEILMGGLMIGFAGAGFIVGKDFGMVLEHDRANKSMAKNLPTIIDFSGQTGAYAILERIETNIPEAMKMIDDFAKSHPEAMDASKTFYDDPFISHMLDRCK